MQKLFESFIKKETLFTKRDTVLLAVSGGCDSVVMCELFYKAGFSFAIAHCNFQLRGKESDTDELFVKKLAKKYKAPLFSVRFETKKHAKNSAASKQLLNSMHANFLLVKRDCSTSASTALSALSLTVLVLQ